MFSFFGAVPTLSYKPVKASKTRGIVFCSPDVTVCRRSLYFTLLKQKNRLRLYEAETACYNISTGQTKRRRIKGSWFSSFCPPRFLTDLSVVYHKTSNKSIIIWENSVTLLCRDFKRRKRLYINRFILKNQIGNDNILLDLNQHRKPAQDKGFQAQKAWQK